MPTLTCVTFRHKRSSLCIGPRAPTRVASTVPAGCCVGRAECGWVGRTLRIGGATLKVRERITRCKATTVDPETGVSDVDTLGALETGWNHQDFGVYAEVIEGGRIAIGDGVRLR